MRFVDSLSPSGDSLYMGGIKKALEMLDNQNKSTRHLGKCIVIRLRWFECAWPDITVSVDFAYN